MDSQNATSHVFGRQKPSHHHRVTRLSGEDPRCDETMTWALAFIKASAQAASDVYRLGVRVNGSFVCVCVCTRHAWSKRTDESIRGCKGGRATSNQTKMQKRSQAVSRIL